MCGDDNINQTWEKFKKKERLSSSDKFWTPTQYNITTRAIGNLSENQY